MSSARDPQHVRRQLVAELATLLAREERIEAHQREEGREVPSDWPDRAQHRADDDVVAALDDMTLARIAAIHRAIARIDEGTWGTCAACGDAIAAARLAAIPEAESCARCASGREG